MSSTAPFIRSAPTSFRFGLPTGDSLPGSPSGLTLGPTGTAGPAGQSLFSGGPALIIVFIACGLFLGSLTAVITYRMVRSRSATAQSPRSQWNDLEGGSRPTSPKFGEKPDMCDVHVLPFQGPARQSSGLWKNMQPLSALRVTEPKAPSPAKAKRASVSSIDSAYSQASLSSVVLSPPPRYAMDMARPNPPLSPSQYPTSPKAEKLRVAIPIVMPRPLSTSHNPWNVSSPHDVDLAKEKESYFDFESGHHKEIPEFCLGVLEVRHESEARGYE